MVAEYKGGSFYAAIFQNVTDSDGSSLDDSLESPVVLLGLTLDGKIHAGHWPIVANRPISDRVKLPAYKVAVGSPHEIYVEDFSGVRSRPATPEEVDSLSNRTVVAPILLEKAARARLGLEPWRDDYQTLIPDDARTTEALFP